MWNPLSIFQKKVSLCELKLLRFQFTDESTIGELYLNGTLFCYTIEDKDRGLSNLWPLDEIREIKQKGITAIPYGTYDIEMYNSPKHKYLVPLLIKVPGFDFTEIHIGNYAKNSEGCILVGSGFIDNMVRNSKLTFMKLMDELVKYDKITISIQRKI